MIYIFIDVDGVFNSRSSDWNKPGFTIDRDKIANFNSILNDKCFVVLSSSWRNYDDQLKCLVDTGLIFHDMLPKQRLTQSRYSEILGYIEDHKIADNYIVIDDDGSVRNIKDENLVYTQFNEVDGGLNKSKMNELKEKLNNLIEAYN